MNNSNILREHAAKRATLLHHYKHQLQFMPLSLTATKHSVSVFLQLEMRVLVKLEMRVYQQNSEKSRKIQGILLRK